MHRFANPLRYQRIADAVLPWALGLAVVSPSSSLQPHTQLLGLAVAGCVRELHRDFRLRLPAPQHREDAEESGGVVARQHSLTERMLRGGWALPAVRVRDRDRVRVRSRDDVEDEVSDEVEAGAADGGWTLRVHLGMKGSWRRLHARQRRPRDPTVLLVTGDAAYACENAYRAELVPTATLRAHPRLARLGPDLLADDRPVEETVAAAVARARMPGHAGREIGDVVMDQRVAAGIGNIYKSETLFETKTHPRTRMHQLDEAAVRTIYEKAAELLRTMR